MTAWANISRGGTGSRLIIANEGTNQNLFNVYIDTQNKLNLAVINNSNSFVSVITAEEELIPGQWYFVALSWLFNGTTLHCTLYLNSTVYTKDVTDFRDFTCVKTAVGSNISGDYVLKGLIKGGISYVLAARYSHQRIDNKQLAIAIASGAVSGAINPFVTTKYSVASSGQALHKGVSHQYIKWKLV